MAGPPLDGVYESTDLGGPLDLGRYTEGFLAPGGAMAVGTTLHAESWDSSDLGLQWRYWCATIQSLPDTLLDLVDGSGNGSRTYKKEFEGGYIWLSGTGPWANGEPDYPGVIDTYVEFETVQYLNWNKIHAVTNVAATAHFDYFQTTCLSFSVANGVEIGSTDDGMTKPSDYPGFIEESTCDPTRVYGAWWNLMTLSLAITGCTTPTQTATWGGIKVLYTD